MAHEGTKENNIKAASSENALPKRPKITATFPPKQVKDYVHIQQLCSDKGLDCSDFGRMAFIHYLHEIEAGRIKF